MTRLFRNEEREVRTKENVTRIDAGVSLNSTVAINRVVNSLPGIINAARVAEKSREFVARSSELFIHPDQRRTPAEILILSNYPRAASIGLIRGINNYPLPDILI